MFPTNRIVFSYREMPNDEIEVTGQISFRFVRTGGKRHNMTAGQTRERILDQVWHRCYGDLFDDINWLCDHVEKFAPTSHELAVKNRIASLKKTLFTRPDQQPKTQKP